jgi:hypothetical protein
MSNCHRYWPDERAGTESRKVSVVKELLERWEQVCHEQPCGLVCGGNAPPSIRHDLLAGRIMTPDGYAQEVAKNHSAAPNARCIVYRRTVADDRVWQSVAIEWLDPDSGEKRVQSGLQLLGFRKGQLVEAWLVLSPVEPMLRHTNAPTACAAKSVAEPRAYGRRWGDHASMAGDTRVGTAS